MLRPVGAAPTSALAKRETKRDHDQRRRRSQPWRSLYATVGWSDIRLAQLAAQPLCERCRALGLTVPAEVVHHVKRHGGDPQKFFCGPFESLCKPHHDRDAQREERSGL